jgi:hypothetical protein
VPPRVSPNRFWRRFALALALVVLAPILILVGVALLGMIAGMLSGARHQSQQVESSVTASTNAAPAVAPQTLTFDPVIERVVVSMDKAVVKQRRFDGEGMIIAFGPMTNRWTPGSLYLDAMLDINLEWPWFNRHGANWVIKTRHGAYADYRLDGSAGPMLGKIVFHPGTPAPEADGSYVIGEFRRDTEAEAAAKKADDSWVFGEFQPGGGQPIPIAVRLAKSSKPSAAAQRLSFGPVIEQLLGGVQGNMSHWLDLDTGRQMSLSFPDDEAAKRALFQTNGVDLMGIVTKEEIGVACREMVLRQVDGARWNLATAEEVFSETPSKPVGSGADDVLAITISPQRKATMFFRTREGGLGILQITGQGKNPLGVKIRYKLVE